ncbi:MAG: AAA family ATPase [Spirochaetia bacterium]|jgi:AAA15 family ATPase/GTPase|nr:AAA family ATPase [Spirochaetia bacterium]
MLLDMTIANFKSVKEPQTISYEAVRDNRFADSKTVMVNDKLRLIKTAAIIGPNGAGKSSFVRALESIKSIVCAPAESENPIQVLSGTGFAYSEEKGEPCTIKLRILLDKGNTEAGKPSIIAVYTLHSTYKQITGESLYFIYDRSKKLMFERTVKEDPFATDDTPKTYAYRFGKMYRGDKRRLMNKVDEKHTFLAAAAERGGETASSVQQWFKVRLNILPMGVSSLSEKYIIEQITAHPAWVQQLINFLWSVDITDIRNILVKNDRLIFVHTNVTMHYASYFMQESLSLRRLTLIGIAFFESFVAQRTLVIDDFGMLLHPDVLTHIIEIFEACNDKAGSQLLAVDCNPTLLRPGLMRRDGIYFAEKNWESSTVYFSLAQFKYSRRRDLTSQQYLNGAFGALPLLSEFSFQDAGKEDK